MESNELKTQLDDLEKEISNARSELDKLAAECISSGKSLSDEPKLFRQSDALDEMFLTEEKLRSMLENYNCENENDN